MGREVCEKRKDDDSSLVDFLLLKLNLHFLVKLFENHT